MKLSKEKLKKTLFQYKLVKIISGLSNFDINYIIRLVKAAEIGQADYVDISANSEIISLVKSFVKIPVCVSSINPIDLYRCTLSGADIVEIGNFDSLYIKGIVFSEDDIIKLAQETRLLLPNSIICVTIPHMLLLDQQIQLASKLKMIGISIVQTEGLMTKLFHGLVDNYISNSINKASLALSSSYAISRSIDIPIISSSGINSISASISIAYQASGVGICSLLKKFNTVCEMSTCINQIVLSLSYRIYTLPQKKSLKIHKFTEIYI